MGRRQSVACDVPIRNTGSHGGREAPTRHSIRRVASPLTPYPVSSFPDRTNAKAQSNSMQLLDFPVEILQEVVEHVDDARDVLSLGLTCSRLKSVTIPFPLEYRNVVWPTHDGTWRIGSSAVKDLNPFGELSLACEDFLSAAPVRWRAIRDVSIYKWGTPVAPRFMQDYVRSDGFILPRLPEEVYDVLMHQANNPQEIIERGNARHLYMVDNISRILGRMPWLTALTWHWFPPEVDSDLWRVLDKMNSLRKVCFVFNTDFTHGYNATALSTIVGRLVQSIAGCGSLETLAINVPIARNGHHDSTWNFDHIYDVTWPLLRQLDLSHTRITSDKKFMLFLSRHDQLEHLRISESTLPSVQVETSQLPNLVNVDVPNFKLAKSLINPKESTIQPDARRVHGLRIQSALIKSQFATLCDILPRIASTLQTLNISLNVTSDADIPTVLDRAPNLVNLEITGHNVMDVLSAARRVRSRHTLQALNSGPMRDWTNIRFPMDYVDHLGRWASCFSKASKLKTLLLRCSTRLSAHDKPAMYDEAQSVSLSDVFRPVVSNVIRVQTQVMQGRDLGLLITCYRKD
ncbi:hypothetical protein CALVIDRAFT_200156 [Calocera viscosa TUFC12733]|uniref:F-box domain-containing protein n=1 Tax=Calocera viscosa (strain TUFC12733) TaxID=1330018 RepID=A0A167KL74_CALVF|nr:hypothetical protein CALVIDRAFT_200156 [Calocera viscosa TUFC12733]